MAQGQNFNATTAAPQGQQGIVTTLQALVQAVNALNKALTAALSAIPNANG